MGESFMEVSKDKANYCVIFTRNGVYDKKILKKFYYYLPISLYCAAMVEEILYKFPSLIAPGIRMDIYSVINGKVCLND